MIAPLEVTAQQSLTLTHDIPVTAEVPLGIVSVAQWAPPSEVARTTPTVPDWPEAQQTEVDTHTMSLRAFTLDGSCCSVQTRPPSWVCEIWDPTAKHI